MARYEKKKKNSFRFSICIYDATYFIYRYVLYATAQGKLRPRTGFYETSIFKTGGNNNTIIATVTLL